VHIGPPVDEHDHIRILFDRRSTPETAVVRVRATMLFDVRGRGKSGSNGGAQVARVGGPFVAQDGCRRRSDGGSLPTSDRQLPRCSERVDGTTHRGYCLQTTVRFVR
jgi:hypothetical protein